MRTLALFFILLVPAAFAAGPPLENFCQPFAVDGCEIIWEATTNRLPAVVKVFKVVPTRFSPATLSNLLQIAELTPKSIKQPPRTGAFNEKDVLCFGDKKESRHLLLVPSQGYIVLNKDGIIATPKEEVPKVPKPKEAVRLTLNLLSKLELIALEIATNSSGEPLLTSVIEQSDMYRKKSTRQITTNTISCGITLTRQIDGIPVWGSSGVFANYGDHNELANLTITWRSIQADKTCALPDAVGMMQQIKSGKSLIRDEHAAHFKKLTIKKVQLYYWESEGSQRQNMIYPFAVLDAATDLPGDKAKIQLFVPFANE